MAESEAQKNVHTEHCCALHGCKYSHDECPVESKAQEQSYPCEECPTLKEAEEQFQDAQEELNFIRRFTK